LLLLLLLLLLLQNEGIVSLRFKQMRNYLVALMMAVGTPMMVMGEAHCCTPAFARNTPQHAPSHSVQRCQVGHNAGCRILILQWKGTVR
jgi:hypothetical protein